MSDNHFATLVSKDSSANAVSNPMYIQLVDGTDSALIDGSGNLQVILAANDGTDIGDVTINNAGGASAVNIQDGGNTITVDGTVGISGTVTVDTELNTFDLDTGAGTDTQPAVGLLYGASGGSVVVSDSNPLPVSGTFSNNSVKVDDTAFTVATDSVTAIGGIATSDSVDANDVGALRMLTNRALVTTLEDSNGDGIAIDGSGNVAAILAANSGVDIGDVTINNAAGASAVNIQDGGNTITVDGTVAATQSGSWDIGTVTTLTSITNDVNIADGGNSITVDNSTLSVVGGGTEATALRVTIASDSTGLLSIDDNGGSLTVDQSTADSLNANANIQVGDVDVSASNPVPVTIVDPVASTTEIHDYDTAASVAGSGTDNHDYTASGGTFVLKQITLSSSGASKVEVINDATGTPATVWVGFVPKTGGSLTHTFNPSVEVANGDVLRLTRTNREGSSQDLYSTIEGNQL